MGSIPLCIRFNNGFIKICNKIKYLVLFGIGFYNEILDRIKYVISKKGGITDSINHNFEKIRINLYHSLPIEKILTF